MLKEEREQLQELIGQTMVVLGDLDEIDKTVSRLRNESAELYNKLDTALDGNGN